MPTPQRVDGSCPPPAPGHPAEAHPHQVSAEQADAAIRLRGLLADGRPSQKLGLQRHSPPGTPPPAFAAGFPERPVIGRHGPDTRGGTPDGLPGGERGPDADRRMQHLVPMDGRGGQDGGQDDADDRPDTSDATQDAVPRPPFSSGDAILAGLGMAPAEPVRTAAAEVPAVARASSPGELSSLVDQLAERVLVGQRADGEQELRVTLRGPTLDGTEIRIARHQGTIEVQVIPKLEAAQELLRTEGAKLSDTLAQRLGQPVVVEVAAGGGMGQQPGGQDGRRSRSFEDIVRYAADRDR